MDCTYCDEEGFESEDDLYEHLHQDHSRDELGRLDQKRLESKYSEDSSGSRISLAFIVGLFIVTVIIGIIAASLYMNTDSGSPGAEEYDHVEVMPTGQNHYHGTWHMEVNDEKIDFSASEYQLRDSDFHFEGGDGETWHSHANRISLQYALATLGFELTEEHVAFDDETYQRGEEATVTIRVSGQSVNPYEYTLEEGDVVEISIVTEG